MFRAKKNDDFLTGQPLLAHICATGFLGFHSSLITFQIFVRLLHLIAQIVAELSTLTNGIRVTVRACCAKDVSRGSVVGLEI
jgi:hypothetical protein